MVDISEIWYGDQCESVRVTVMRARSFNPHSLTSDDPGKVKGEGNRIARRYLHSHVYCTTHTHTHTHTQCAVLFSQEKEGNSATCGNMDGTWENIMPSEIRQNKKTTTV